MSSDDDRLRRILQEAKVVATVGASGTEGKAAHDVPAYLQDHGYEIVPVNPASDEVLGAATAPNLAQLDRDVDLVQVFRPADEAPGLARAAVAAGARVLWLQEGITSDEARKIAEEGGLEVVMDECMMVSHRRLLGDRAS